MSMLPSSILLPTFLQPEKVWLLLISNVLNLSILGTSPLPFSFSYLNPHPNSWGDF